MPQHFKYLPPVRALVSFEAAARNLNFTKAADELYVTRVAVSRQVKLLEEFLGLQLFVREPRRLRLSPAGERLYRVVNASFHQIHDVTESLCQRSNPNIINLTTTPGVSIYWLMPRIGKFRLEHPEIDFRIDSDVELSDLARDGFDIAIRYGSGDWPDLEARLLDYQYVFPTCSPGYLTGRKAPTTAEELLDEHLLHFDTPYDRGSTWPGWFEDQGVDYLEGHRQSRFTSFVNTVQALLDGQGIALVGPPVLQQFYDNGMLINVLNTKPIRLMPYYLAWPARTTLSAASQTFVDWVESELASDKT